MSKNRNGTLFAHVYLWDAANRTGSPYVVYHNVANASAAVPTGGLVAQGASQLIKHLRVSRASSSTTGLKGIYAHVRPRLTLLIVGPKQRVFGRWMIPEMMWAVQGSNLYKPLMWADDFMVTDKEYTVLNQDARSPDPTIPLKLSSIGLPLYRLLMSHQKLESNMELLGLTGEDILEVRQVAVMLLQNYMLVVPVAFLLPLWIGLACLRSSCSTNQGSKKEKPAAAPSKTQEKKDD
mmetsp:Transcript_32657/g.92619  ORF Transcript_32657/g.92619 Transcript_32657/m.92619 type:complete len:236 (-) Transcript_32657:2168-2875(-)